MLRLQSILFWTFFATSMVPFFAVGLLIWLVTFPFDRNRRILHLYSCFWAQTYLHVNRAKQQFQGREKLPWRGAAVLVSNHESLGDILVLFGLYRPYKWVSKASVFRAPFLGWNMWLNGYVGLVRGNRGSIVKMMSDCRAWLDRGVPVLMFPEGTRSPDGEIQPFKDGAFRLAVEQGCPVIPIVLTGTADALPKHGFLFRGQVDARVRILDPVDPAPFNGDYGALRDAVRALMVAEKAAMVGKAAAAALAGAEPQSSAVRDQRSSASP